MIKRITAVNYTWKYTKTNPFPPPFKVKMTDDYQFMCGLKSENFWVANVLPDYHKFKVDKIVTRFINPVVIRRWMYQGGNNAPLTVNMERVPKSQLYLWRDKFGQGFTGTASGDDFLEAAQRKVIVRNGQRRAFYRVTTRFPRLRIDANMAVCSDLLALMATQSTTTNWFDFLKKIGIKEKFHGYKDIHNMNFAIQKRSGVSTDADMFRVDETWGKVDVYMHEMLSFDIETKIYIRLFRRNE